MITVQLYYSGHIIIRILSENTQHIYVVHTYVPD